MSWNILQKKENAKTFSHAPRERVSWNYFCSHFISPLLCHAPRERVSWNCRFLMHWKLLQRHAPRERVSWNVAFGAFDGLWANVTLHVSVWVEIPFWWLSEQQSASRSTWACELKSFHERNLSLRATSRSTWACELKLILTSADFSAISHAPRERVSWNYYALACQSFARVTLHVSVWVEISNPSGDKDLSFVTLHVSVWVEIVNSSVTVVYRQVTLHVSVWVEIAALSRLEKNLVCHAPRERVSWNAKTCKIINTGVGHAPRERVSWNPCVCRCFLSLLRHAPRERVSWNYCSLTASTTCHVTLHVSVWVEIRTPMNQPKYQESRSTWACELKL